jgi:iron complex transport system permease protein
MATRMLPMGPDIKVGVFTSLVGAPFFFWLIVRMRRTTP